MTSAAPSVPPPTITCTITTRQTFRHFSSVGKTESLGATRMTPVGKDCPTQARQPPNTIMMTWLRKEQGGSGGSKGTQEAPYSLWKNNCRCIHHLKGPAVKEGMASTRASVGLTPIRPAYADTLAPIGFIG